ncbi:MAG: GNAT family N-acetyltransferase [Bryobacteraceae bacterium]
MIVRTPENRRPEHIDVIPATPEDEPILANLLELYVHDFSEFFDIDLGVDGRFGYKPLPLYWRDPSRHPFLVRMDGKLAGFVLVKKGSEVSDNPSVWDMAEFFVLRGYRRRGIGIDVAHEVWRRFRGVWEVRVMEANISAYQFWERAIAVFLGTAIPSVSVKKGGTCWRVFSFESEHAVLSA